MKRYSFFIFLMLTLLAFVLFTGAQSASSASSRSGPDLSAGQIGVNQETPTDQIIIRYKDTGANQAALIPSQTDVVERLNAAAGVSLQYGREMSGGASVYKLPGKTSLAEVNVITRKLNALPEVEYAEPDLIMQPMQIPNDPLYANQWGYFAPTAGNYGINMPAAWDITTGASNVVVAVIDTGITDHADLAGRTVPGYDFISNVVVANDGDSRDADPHDPGDWTTVNLCYNGSQPTNSSWHGTHTAGTIGAASNNGVGVAGVNWNSKIEPVRVLGSCGGYSSDIADGMRWAAGLPVAGVPNNANPAKVISLSLGSTSPASCLSTYQDTLNDIYAAGTIVIVAAGNSNSDAGLYTLANCNHVIPVAATNRSGSRAYYSNYGSVVKISAPGGAQSSQNDPNGILSTLNTGTTFPLADTYIYYQGTSMATPHVSGVVSLLYSLDPSITPDQVLQVLQSTVTAFPVGSTCNTSICGSGIVNAGNAVALLPRLTALDPGVSKKSSASINLKVNGSNFNNSSKIKWNGIPLTTTVTSSNVLSTTIPGAYLNSYGTYSVTVSTNLASLGTLDTRILPFIVYDHSDYLPLLTKPTPPPPPIMLVNGDFESGPIGWTEYSSHSYGLIVTTASVGTVPTHGGSYEAWLGGDNNEVSYIQQHVTVNLASPYLAYWHWIDSPETTCGNDVGGVEVNGVWFEKYNLCKSTNTGKWVKHVVNLSAYAGQTISIQIRAETNSSTISSLYIDDVSFQSTPTLTGEGIPGGNETDTNYLTRPVQRSTR